MTTHSINQPVAESQATTLVFTGEQVNALLGISSVTRWRLEKRGLLTPVSGLRHKIYSRRAVEAFLERKPEVSNGR